MEIEHLDILKLVTEWLHIGWQVRTRLYDCLSAICRDGDDDLVQAVPVLALAVPVVAQLQGVVTPTTHKHALSASYGDRFIAVCPNDRTANVRTPEVLKLPNEFVSRSKSVVDPPLPEIGRHIAGGVPVGDRGMPILIGVRQVL